MLNNLGIPEKVMDVALESGVNPVCVLAMHTGGGCRTCRLLLTQAFDVFYFDVPSDELLVAIEMDLMKDVYTPS